VLTALPPTWLPAHYNKTRGSDPTHAESRVRSTGENVMMLYMYMSHADPGTRGIHKNTRGCSALFFILYLSIIFTLRSVISKERTTYVTIYIYHFLKIFVYSCHFYYLLITSFLYFSFHSFPPTLLSCPFLYFSFFLLGFS
jgi:hypothetical protein